MAEILLFHHALGLTQGVLDFAADMSSAGHRVHTPDLFGGQCFTSIDEGVAFARSVGFDTIMQRGIASADPLPRSLIYMGFSLGVMPAQCLAQTRDGARGAVLIDACVPAAEFSEVWPKALPVQIHGMDADPFFRDDGDLDAAKALVADAPLGELFLYNGDRHLFADRSLDAYDPPAAKLLMERVLGFLERYDT